VAVFPPRIDTIERIAQALDISVEQLQFQHPETNIAEAQSNYGADTHVTELVEALDRLPRTKKNNMIRTFMELIRLASGENDG
jgi:transcriptional regulator with XRE-family HTH domain